MTVAEGGGRRAVAHKLQDVYLPALKANYVIWPTVQVLNFRVTPLQFQLVSATVPYPGLIADRLLASRLDDQHCLDRISLPDELS